LRHALHGAGLVYAVEDGVVVVTPEGTGRERLVRRVYPVADLVGASGKADNLIEVLTTTIGPGSWAPEGGPGTIAYFAEGQCLVVSQSAAVQDEVRQLLEELRAARPAQRKGR
jgi:hypothetical protein